MAAQPFQHLFLRRLVEIDQHVAAEDHVHFAIDRIAGIHQIEAQRTDRARSSGRCAPACALGPWSAAHSGDASPSAPARHLLGIDRRAARPSTSVEMSEAEMSTEPGRLRPIGQHHGERVGFGADRARRAPDLQGRAGPGRRLSTRHGVSRQKTEMARLAEEIGLVGGDGIDQLHGFGVEAGLLEHQPQYSFEVGMPSARARRRRRPSTMVSWPGAS